MIEKARTNTVLHHDPLNGFILTRFWMWPGRAMSDAELMRLTSVKKPQWWQGLWWFKVKLFLSRSRHAV